MHRHDRPFQQQQGTSNTEAPTSAGMHHAPRPSTSQQGMGLNQVQPRQQGPSGSAISQADPRLPYQPNGGRLPGPYADPQGQQGQGGLGSQPSPSQQITAQAARHEPQRINQAQNQAAGNGGLPPSLLQFGSMQHVPNLPKSECSQPTPNPLQFGIPAGMLTGAGGDQRGQPASTQGQQGEFCLCRRLQHHSALRHVANSHADGLSIHLTLVCMLLLLTTPTLSPVVMVCALLKVPCPGPDQCLWPVRKQSCSVSILHAFARWAKGPRAECTAGQA